MGTHQPPGLAEAINNLGLKMRETFNEVFANLSPAIEAMTASLNKLVVDMAPAITEYYATRDTKPMIDVWPQGMPWRCQSFKAMHVTLTNTTDKHEVTTFGSDKQVFIAGPQQLQVTLAIDDVVLRVIDIRQLEGSVALIITVSDAVIYIEGYIISVDPIRNRLVTAVTIESTIPARIINL